MKRTSPAIFGTLIRLDRGNGDEDENRDEACFVSTLHLHRLYILRTFLPGIEIFELFIRKLVDRDAHCFQLDAGDLGVDLGRHGIDFLLKNDSTLEKKVYSVPAEIDAEIARIKLEAMGIKIDKLSDAQLKYLNSWQEGT